MKDNISSIRLQSHQLTGSRFDTPRELLAWMGAIQAQDFTMAKWAIGIRLRTASEKQIEEAFNRGEILRTHVMRPTWHFVNASDIRWMLRLSAQRIKMSSVSRDRDLEITEALYAKVNLLLEDILRDGNDKTREEIAEDLNKKGIVTDSSRMIHFMMRAEVEGIVCSGRMKGKKHTYALLDERIAPTKEFSKEEALARLARNYFQSHSPAGLPDFIWWSGLSVADAKAAIGLLGDELMRDCFPDPSLLLHRSYASSGVNVGECVHLLPAFDEYLISYKDRTTVLDPEHHPKAFTKNGTFYPVVAHNGVIVGTWKKTNRKQPPLIQTSFFEEKTNVPKQLLEKAQDAYRLFG